MNAHSAIGRAVRVEMSSDGLVTIPLAVRQATGLIPGMEVTVGVNDRGEAVVMSRMRAKRLEETAEERRARIEAALGEAASGRYSTGQTTAEVMEELRGRPPQ